MLLGKALQALNDHPVFAGSDLKGPFSGTEAELRLQIESPSLEDVSRFWKSLDYPMVLAAFCEVSGVAILPESHP